MWDWGSRVPCKKPELLFWASGFLKDLLPRMHSSPFIPSFDLGLSCPCTAFGLGAWSPTPGWATVILTVHILLKPGLENFEHYFTSM